MAHSAQNQLYIKTQGNTLLRKLPEESKHTLRYYETVKLLESLEALPPLRPGRRIIPGKAAYNVVITDWSLLIVRNDNKVEGSVLLEVPWFYVTELVSSWVVDPFKFVLTRSYWFR